MRFTVAVNNGVLPLAKQVSPTRTGAPVNEEVCRVVPTR